MTYMDVCLILFIIVYIFMSIGYLKLYYCEKNNPFFEKLIKFLELGFMVAAVLLGLFGGLIYG